MPRCTTFWRTCRHCVERAALKACATLRRQRPRVAQAFRPARGRATFGIALALGVLVTAQSEWPTYHGDYSGRRHSPLTQITPANVHQLTLACAFQTGQTHQIKSTPILVNGVIYITSPDNIWALDSRSARQLC